MKSKTQWAIIPTSVKPSLWNNCITIIETPYLMYAIAKFYHCKISLWYAICIDECYRYYLNSKNVDTYANSLCLFLFLLSMSGMDRDLARGLLFKSNILCRFWFCGPFFVTPVSATKSENNEGYELTWYQQCTRSSSYQLMTLLSHVTDNNTNCGKFHWKQAMKFIKNLDTLT